MRSPSSGRGSSGASVRWFAWEVNDNIDTAAEAGKPAGFSPFDYDYDYEHEHDYDYDYDYDYDRRMHAAANRRLYLQDAHTSPS